MRWCWVNFQCRGILIVWFIVGQKPTALAVRADGCCLLYIYYIYIFSIWYLKQGVKKDYV